MHFRLVLRIVAALLIIVAFFMIFPLIVALYYREFELVRSFLIPIGISLCISAVIFVTCRPSSGKITTRDGFLLVTASWLSASAISALPFVISGAIPGYVNAFFETMSGYTTTGASILTDIESLPKGMLFWRSLTHWLGGMGIVVLTAAVLPLLGIGAYQLIKAEAPGPTLDKMTPKIAKTAKILWAIYGFFTVAQTTLLMVGGMSLFDALTHTFGTLATGGFSPKALSVGHYNSAYIDAVTTVFMVLAGMNFALYFWAATGKFRKLLANVEMKVYLAIFVVASLAIALSLFRRTYGGFGTSLRYATFQSATILTTTGYVTADYAKWPEFARIVLFTLMFIGGCSGSTGGGIKVVRIITMARLAVSEMKYLAHPRGVFSVNIGKQPIGKEVVYTVAAFFFLYIMMLLITTMVVASGGNDILTSFSAAAATLGNIGPGFGKVGPSGNYAYLQPYIKWFLSFSMLIGRLELYTVLVLFMPGVWRI